MLSLRFPRGIKGQLNAAPWLKFIHAVNSIEGGFFGQPSYAGPPQGGGSHPGDYVEEYPHAQVLFPGDDALTVRISAKDEHGERIMRQAGNSQQLEPNPYKES